MQNISRRTILKALGGVTALLTTPVIAKIKPKVNERLILISDINNTSTCAGKIWYDKETELYMVYSEGNWHALGTA